MSSRPSHRQRPHLARAVIATLLAALLVGGAIGTATVAAQDAEPAQDIFVVMIDDHGYLDDERVLERLPNIKRLFVDGGLRLDAMYDETPLCCPARATVLSGQHTLGHGVIANNGPDLDPSITIATALDEAGYHTIHTGKFMTSYRGPVQPPGWDRVLMRKDKTEPSFWVDGELVSFAGQHQDQVVREFAVDWLREAPLDEPVFAHITPGAPHRESCQGQGKSDTVRHCDYLPLRIESDIGDPACADIPDWKPPDYEIIPSKRGAPWAMPPWPDGWPLTSICESLLVVDRMVGELAEAQAERGRPATWFFLSDNGMSWGRKSFPLKHAPTATRLPFYVAGTGIGTGNDTTLLSNIDLAPTIADIAGTELSIADGTSFLPLLRGEAFEGRDEVLEIMPATPGRAYKGWAGFRTPRWRFIRWDDGATELYDLRADPWEQQDLSESMRGRARRMESRLENLIADSRR